MKLRITTTLIDIAALYGIAWLAAPHGTGAIWIACLSFAAYSIYTFVDGMRR